MVDVTRTDANSDRLIFASTRNRRPSTFSSGFAAAARVRFLIRPQPGFYVLRLTRRGPLAPAIIQQLCPMVLPQPGYADGPHPDDWCRPLDRPPKFQARIDGKRVPIDWVWTARSIRSVTAAEYAFRIGPLRQWALSRNPMPEARPQRQVNFAALPPLF